MRRIWCVLLTIVSALLLLTQFSEASSLLTIDEAATRLLFVSDKADLDLVATNAFRKPVSVKIRLELLSQYNRLEALIEQDATLNPGTNTINVSLPLKPLASGLWRRLRYYVTPNSTGIKRRVVSGTISLSQICPDFFRLSIVKPAITADSTRYLVRVRAEHPITLKAISGVQVDGELTFDGSKSALTASGVTDDDGYAPLGFDLPSGIKTNGKLEITGERNGLSSSIDHDVRIDHSIRVCLSTDKTIYQPAQTLHVRALVINPNQKAIAGESLALKILDPDETVVHRATLKTTRFGIAADDWAIPANTRLGDYEIKIDRDESDDEDVYLPPYRIRISRYELPNFTVVVKPDRGFYLPDQQAKVDVRGDYLFGQPVTRGRVRVVRETYRDWNYREQKWEIKEEQAYEGELDNSGSFIASVDLSKDHLELGDRDYSRYKDISYTAYVTDLSTNRTEQRRFDLRVSREPIHVYVIDDGNKVRGQPVSLFVSTSYADGTPAESSVDISEDLSQEWSGTVISRSRLLKTVKTNRYGIAKVTGLMLSDGGRGALSHRSWDDELDFSARDRGGQKGHTSQSVWYATDSFARVETDKAIYKPGEPIQVEVAATGSASRLFVEIARKLKVISSRTIALVNGRGRFSVPYNPEFKDEVSIVVYGDTTKDRMIQASRTVLYPRNHELSLKVNLNQPQYRPGEQASVRLEVRSAAGDPVESAVGVSVIDRAVLERARSDSEFAQRNDFAQAFYSLLGYEESIAGITLRSLDGSLVAKPIPSDLQTVAEILLLRRGYELDSDSVSVASPESEFHHILESQLKPVRNALEARYKRKGQYPISEAMLNRELADFGLDFPNIRDPWGCSYDPKFSVNRDRLVMRLVSNGPDKRSGTRDDFTATEFSWPYFREMGEKINRAVNSYHQRTGQFIRDFRVLRNELFARGTDVDKLRDHWGQPYRFKFGIRENYLTIEVGSAGSDKRFDGKKQRSLDDFVIWTSKIDYFADTKARVNDAISSYLTSEGNFPQNEEEFASALKWKSIDWENLRDPWGNRYYAVFKAESQYETRVKIISFSQYLAAAGQRTELTPVTALLTYVYVRSNGEDREKGTRDDFNVASFSRLAAEQTANDAAPVRSTVRAAFSGSTGAINGTVTDPNGAVISGAVVNATSKRSGEIYSGKTNDEGRYLIVNVPAGLYEVKFYSPGFNSTVITDVPVSSSNVVEVSVYLSVGATAESVMVTAEASPVQTSSASVAVVEREKRTSALVHVKQLPLTSTPRLREYFPETLVWQPLLEADRNGNARLNFKLADNITTWKMSVVASNADGEIGTAENEILAFQPFFIEHDPPRVLTETDEISLPIVLRNYLDKPQTVDLEIKPESWFSILGSSRKQSKVPAGDAAKEVFDIRAVASVENGKQRVSASGGDENDAVEKPVTVHPNGKELSVSSTQIFSGNTSMTVDVPEAAIPGSARAELKIYPNLIAHVIESIEGIVRRPHGCAEQTISSAYPSLLLLKHLDKSGDQSSDLAEKARRYVKLAYEQILNYRDDDGGFTYWGRGHADPSLTAYALRFLTDAKKLIDVDDQVQEDARKWLIKNQQPDGSWGTNYSTDTDRISAAVRTAFIARVLASPDAQESESTSTAGTLKRALTLLGRRVDEIDEPYLIASYAMTASYVGEKTNAARAIEKLRGLAHDERDGSYWKLETNTPFYGWGLTGRIEATALAVQTLASVEDWSGTTDKRSSRELVNRGLLFLLRQKDRECVWYSTQTTVNVLDALMTVLGRNEPTLKDDGSTAEITVNGTSAAQVSIPSSAQIGEPINIDISKYLTAGNNRVEIRRGTGSGQASAQLIESHYEKWPENQLDSPDNEKRVGALKLRVAFDKTNAQIGDEISCSVRVERVGFRGYGMLLAEIGLPPGADVDRASLDRAVKETGWSVDSYDILPDRLIVYLWPQAGGTSFNFKFRTRFGLKASTAASSIYDYYNPDARAVVAPARFVIR